MQFKLMLTSGVLSCFAIGGLAPLSLAAAPHVVPLKFSFGSGKCVPGYTLVSPTNLYSRELGYGFEPGAKIAAVSREGEGPLRAGFCTSDRPFFFSVAVPEGNYEVKVTLGDSTSPAEATIKAETRRLMVERVRTPAGEFATRVFDVNVRTAKIDSNSAVRLKQRELGPPLVPHWDEKLTLEFNGTRPCLCGLEIRKLDNAVTVYLAGDSTVTDQPNEPWNSWGQMLPRFFKPGVAVANHAESGESLKSFLAGRRLDKILSTLKAGDYLFVQFGHNDQKDKSPNAGAYTTYATNLHRFVAEARRRGGLPVLVTSMHRMRFDAQGKVAPSLGDFPDAVRRVAREEKIPLIDLNEMSGRFYEALGPEKCKLAFQDGTHHNAYGSYELAKCVVEGIKSARLGLTNFLADDVPAFDPGHPDDPAAFAVPPSPQSSKVKPEGS